MKDTILNLFFLCSRYVHILATAVIFGGTLFFELVVPAAIGELKTEVQLALIGRMRWLFRWVVYTCTIALIATGSVAIYQHRSVLDGTYLQLLDQFSPTRMQVMEDQSILNQPKPWFVAHIVAGLVSIGIAILLVSGGRPPERPVQWMRLNLFLLMIAIFLASASRAARQNLFQPLLRGQTIPGARE